MNDIINVEALHRNGEPTLEVGIRNKGFLLTREDDQIRLVDENGNLLDLGVDAYLNDGTSVEEAIQDVGGDFIERTQGINGKTFEKGIKSKTTTLPSSLYWRDVAYGNGVFVAIADNPTQYGARSEDGETWTQITMPLSGNWESIAYGNDKFVVVGYQNTASQYGVYSTDGKVWIQVNLSYSSCYNCICYGNDRFVAVGNDGYGVFSTDGINWSKSNPIFNLNKSYYNTGCVCYGNDKFICIPYNLNERKNLSYSTDGNNWTEISMDFTGGYAYIHSICYGNGMFICIPFADDNIYRSTDGIVWDKTPQPSEISQKCWASVVYGDGIFLTVDGNDNNLFSFDGIIWNSVSLLPIPAPGNGGVAYNDHKFVYVGLNSKIGYVVEYFSGDITLTSSDLLGSPSVDQLPVVWPVSKGGTGAINQADAWKNLSDFTGDKTPTSILGTYSESEVDALLDAKTPTGLQAIEHGGTGASTVNGAFENLCKFEPEITLKTMPQTINYSGIAYGDGIFVTGTYASTTPDGYYSTDGINWTRMEMQAFSYRSIAYGNGKFVAVAVNQQYGSYSTDGKTWIQMNMNTSRQWWSVCYGNNKFVAVSADNNAYGAYSTDGITWTQMSMVSNPYWKVCYGNGVFIATGNINTANCYSTNGTSWTSFSMPSNYNWYACYGNGMFVATSASPSLYAAYSLDGKTWTQTMLPKSGNWTNITYGDNIFISFNSNDTIGAYTIDGINWFEFSIPEQQYYSYECCAYGNGVFIVVPYSGSVYQCYIPIFGPVGARQSLGALSYEEGQDVVDSYQFDKTSFNSFVDKGLQSIIGACDKDAVQSYINSNV